MLINSWRVVVAVVSNVCDEVAKVVQALKTFYVLIKP